MNPKKYTVTVTFSSLEDAVSFSEALAPVGMCLYHADVLDNEFQGASIPVGSLVLRPTDYIGKTDDMKVSL